MKFPLVSRKQYDEMKLKMIKAQKDLEENKKKEYDAIVPWAVQLENYEELFIVYATDISRGAFSNTIVFWDGNKRIGSFDKVEFYVQYDNYDLEENYLSENDV